MTSDTRRKFLKLSAATVGTAAAANFWPALIEKALAIGANNSTGSGSLNDIEHVIIFMQENRSFDHYFGSLAGVRGFGDPRPAPIPSGNYVWYQPEGKNQDTLGVSNHIDSAQWVSTKSTWYQTAPKTSNTQYVLPFRLNQPGKNPKYQYAGDLDHSWKQSQDVWKNWDVWPPLKSRQSMGFLNADDLPFYYSLANAFTVCDAYHCSVFAATDPNRYYLWTGKCLAPTDGPDNYGKTYAAPISNDINTAITPAMYGQSDAAKSAAAKVKVADWETYAETLTNNSITWKIYQESDNYGDNYLQYFKNFRIDNSGVTIDKSVDPYFQTLFKRGRAVATSSATTAVGEAVIAAFTKDVALGTEPDNPGLGSVAPGLPRVSWIVAPSKYCEHPSSAPGDGEIFTARILDVLVNQYPDVFSKTLFMLMYDENDGYFDHVPAPIPPTAISYGEMTLDDAGTSETYSNFPVGLGPRVPMLLISPWTAGGRVNSQVLDHTSTLMFLETWLTAKGLATADKIKCPNISPWRRAVCEDLTAALDFGDTAQTTVRMARDPFNDGNQSLVLPSPQTFPAFPAPIVRPASPLNYEFFVEGRVTGPSQFALNFANTGGSGVPLIAYWQPMSTTQTPLHYTIEAGKSLSATPPVTIGTDGLYDWEVHGPNGFLREFRGNANSSNPAEVTTCYDVDAGAVRVTLDNSLSRNPSTFQLADNAYAANQAITVNVAAGDMQTLDWVGAPVMDPASKATVSSGWYDASIRIAEDPTYLRRVAGCVQRQTGLQYTDPAIGNLALFAPSINFRGTTPATMRCDYVNPPWVHRPLNWVGLFTPGKIPGSAVPSLNWAYAPRGVGSIALSSFVRGPVAPGTYDAYLLSNDGYTIIAGPVSVTV